MPNNNGTRKVKNLLTAKQKIALQNLKKKHLSRSGLSNTETIRFNRLCNLERGIPC